MSRWRVSDAQWGVAGVLEDEGFAARAVRCVEGVDGGDFERDVVVLEADGKGVAAAGVCGSCVEELEASAIAGAWCAVAVERELGAGFGDVSAGEQQVSSGGFVGELSGEETGAGTERYYAADEVVLDGPGLVVGRLTAGGALASNARNQYSTGLEHISSADSHRVLSFVL